MKNVNVSLPGGGVFLLTITFVVLKALEYLDWSWVWVFSPLWISGALILSVLAILGIVMLGLWWWEWSS